MKKLIYLTLIILFVFSCESDNNSSENTQIQAYWLKIYNPNSITGVGQVFYNESNILWTFDFQNQTINVELLNGEEPILLESGNYDYYLEENNCGATDSELIINNTYYGDLIISNTPGVLVLEDICFTARRLVFEEI